MYLFLAILAVLVLLIIFILLLPIKIYFKCDFKQPTKTTVKILFFNLFKKQKKAKKQSKTAQKIKRALGISKLEKQNLKALIKEKGIREALLEVFSLLKDILNTLLSVVKKIKIAKLNTSIIIASDDAAATALYYGGCCAAVGTALGSLNSIVKIKDKSKETSIVCDFSKTECEFFIEAKIKIRIFNLVLAAIRFATKRLKS